MLRQLYQQSTPSMNPSYLTGVLPGGAGAATAGTTPNPGISAPYIEDYLLEVYDVTAPTLIGTANPGKTLGTPAIAGKLLVLDPLNSGPGGWLWKQSSVAKQPIPGGQYGIVYKPASPTTAGNFANGSIAVGTANGNIAQPGDKALVVIDGPVPAFVQTTVGGVAVSAGMPLVADGAGNLTPINQGTPGGTGAALPPLPGQVLAIAMQNVAVSISIPQLVNVFVGGY
jgi:hypothetical protein